MIIAISAEKGGVGKTTTTINLAAEWSHAGHRVLVVDADPQGNATHGLGILGDGLALRAAIEHGEVPTPELSEYGPHVLASGAALSGLDVELARKDDGERYLATMLEHVRTDWDVIIIDTPPMLGSMLTTNALVAADWVLVTAQCKMMSLRGVGAVIDTLTEGIADAPELVGILPTMMDARTSEGAAVLEHMRKQYGSAVVEPPIRDRTAASVALGLGMPVRAHAARDGATQDYASAARELAQRMDL